MRKFQKPINAMERSLIQMTVLAILTQFAFYSIRPLVKFALFQNYNRRYRKVQCWIDSENIFTPSSEKTIHSCLKDYEVEGNHYLAIRIIVSFCLI